MPSRDLSSLTIREGDRGGRSGSRFLRLVAAALGVLVIALGVLFALRRQNPAVEVVSARPADDPQAQTLLNASGYVTPRRRATVAAKITGRVTGVFFDEGMSVNEGQLLASLDESDARRALASAVADRNAAQAAIVDLQVQLNLAELQLQRSQVLFQEKVQSQEALDTARTNVDSLRARIDLVKVQVEASAARVQEAQQNVDNCTIKAPFGGVIVSKDAQIGEMVSPLSAGGGFTRTGIATLVDMNSNEIEVDVNEAYIARVRPSQKVVATLDAYPDWQIPSHVRTIIPTADREKATVKVRISFDKLDPRILPDMGVKVAFLAAASSAPRGKQKAAAKAIIPQNTVFEGGSASYVFEVRDAKLERRAVTLGRQMGTDVEVVAGVSPGDQLAVHGSQRLQDGESVAVKQ